jgi:Na+-transporting NADH:ubiquinone oxidoreductase subunit F
LADTAFTNILIAIAVFTTIVLALALIVLAVQALIRQQGGARLIINQDQIVHGELGDRLMDALERAGISLPGSCGGVGTCGLCKVQVSGPCSPVAASPLERTTLSDEEISSGFRLACQTTLRGNVELTLSPGLLHAKSWLADVLETRLLSTLIKEITLGLTPEERTEFPAGGYVLIAAPPFSLDFSDLDIEPDYRSKWERLGLSGLSVSNATEQWRAYSVANRPEMTDRLRLNVRLALPPPANPDAPPGVVSSYLFSLKPNDKVAFSGPYGDFFIRETHSEILLIGGGVGMAPLYAHVYDQLEQLKIKRTISFWYGARSLEDIYYRDEMEALAEKHDNFSWHFALSDMPEDEDRHGEQGFVHEVVYQKYLKAHPAPQSCEYYLCGPPLMIEAVCAMLSRLGVPRKMIFYDEFGG